MYVGLSHGIIFNKIYLETHLVHGITFELLLKVIAKLWTVAVRKGSLK